jgi:ornithine cyclodeaminase/alanine dehydrogenase-like protein (mu-crystallin family)
MYDQRFLYLTQKDVIETGFGVAEVIDTIEQALIEHVERRVEMPPKPGVHPLPDTCPQYAISGDEMDFMFSRKP